MTKRSFAIVLPGHTEFDREIDWDYNDRRSEANMNRLERAIRSVFSELKITTKREDPQTIRVRAYPLVIKGREVEKDKSLVRIMDVMPEIARMTDAEYEKEMADATSELPEEFANFVKSQAYEDGHHAGYEEVVGIAQELANKLQNYVAAYNIRMKITKK